MKLSFDGKLTRLRSHGIGCLDPNGILMISHVYKLLPLDRQPHPVKALTCRLSLNLSPSVIHTASSSPNT